jgi:hypothetical protein
MGEGLMGLPSSRRVSPNSEQINTAGRAVKRCNWNMASFSFSVVHRRWRQRSASLYL